MKQVLICLTLLKCGLFLSAQDTIYARHMTFSNLWIVENQPTFVEFVLDNQEKSKFLKKTDINTIVRKGGFREDIIHDSKDSFHIAYSYLNGRGDTLKADHDYNPTKRFEIDTSIKLCQLKKENYYNSYYGARPHFYINDPGRKFFNCKQVRYVGVNFSFMKLINEHDLPKAVVIKERYLSYISRNINHYENMPKYRHNFFTGKEIIDEMYVSENSYHCLHPMSWVSSQDYQIEPGKIPAIIKELDFAKSQEIGAVFIIEKLSKPQRTVSGYWVIFDFSDRKVLLIDYINYSKVKLQVEAIMDGWYGFWKAGIHSAGVYEPVSFQKYLELERKGQLEIFCD